MNSQNSYERYQRQILLKEFGESGQKKLLAARVLVIGAGGLGCAALQYLTAAGIGTIGMVDFDVVELSNLQRQILFSTDDLGKLKTESAEKRLKALNPEVKFELHSYRIDQQNALSIISNYDLVIDGSDNFTTRYIVNDACVILNKVLVYGAVLGFEGQVGVFNFKNKPQEEATHYRHLFPNPPNPKSIPSCNEAGVLGVLPGIIGVLQATEAIKIISEVGKPLANTIISYNALTNTFFDFEINMQALDHLDFPKTSSEFITYDYEFHCTGKDAKFEISKKEFDKLIAEKNISIVDVRDKSEVPKISEFKHLQIPLHELPNLMDSIPRENKIVFFCQSGIRSANAVKILKEKFPNLIAYSLSGGIVNWKSKQKIAS